MHGGNQAVFPTPDLKMVDSMTTRDELTGILEQTSIYSGRFSEQRALDRLRTVATTAKSPKISNQDLQAMKDEKRLDRVFNKETKLTKTETKIESLKKELHDARSNKKGSVAIKRAKRALGAVTVPVMFGLAAAMMVMTCMSQIQSQAYANQAMDCLNKGDSEQAYENLRKSLVWNPYNVTASFEAGRIDEKRKDRQEAYKHYQRACKIEPNNVELLDRKGSLAIRLNHFQEAADTYTHLLKVSKNDRKQLHHYGNRAVALSKLGQYDKAIDDYTNVLKMKRKDQDALIGRAFCHSQVQEHNEAIADLDRLLEINPSHYEALLLRGWANQSLQAYDDAQADFEAAIALQSKNEKGYMYLAHMFRAAGNNDAALEQLNKVIAFNKDSREAHVVKGQILLASGQHQQALNEFKTVDGLKKEENYFSLLERAKAYLGTGQNQDAITAYSKLIALRPELSELHFERAQAEQAVGEHKKAIKDLDEAIKLYPNYAQAMLKRAECNIALGNEVSAVADFHHAIAATPYEAKPYIAFGKFNLEKQQFATAREMFDKAVKLDAKNATAKQLSVVASNSLKKLVGNQTIELGANVLTKQDVAEIASADFNGLLDKGYNAMKVGKNNYAVTALGKAVRLDPNSKVARRYLTTALLTAGNPSEAEVQINALNQMGAGQDGDAIKLATAYKKSGNCDKAVRCLEAFVGSHPADVNAMTELCDAYAALGNTEKATEVALTAMNKSQGTSNYASLKERYLSLKESQERALQRQQNAGNNATVDTQG